MAVDSPGGAELHLLRLLSGLHGRGWRIALTTPGPGPIQIAAAANGWEWHALAARRTGARGAARGRSGPGRGPGAWPPAHDVMYLNGGVPGRLLPALVGTHALAVLHVHDMVERVPRFWRRAGLVLADSQAVADRVPGLAPRGRLRAGRPRSAAGRSAVADPAGAGDRVHRPPRAPQGRARSGRGRHPRSAAPIPAPAS